MAEANIAAVAGNWSFREFGVSGPAAAQPIIILPANPRRWAFGVSNHSPSTVLLTTDQTQNPNAFNGFDLQQHQHLWIDMHKYGIMPQQQWLINTLTLAPNFTVWEVVQSGNAVNSGE